MAKYNYPNIDSFDELMGIIRNDKKGGELVVIAKASTRNDIIFNLLTEEGWKVSDSTSSNNNRWYLFEKDNLTISINNGDDDIYEDVVVNFGNVTFYV